jgi:hypothetical protein
MFFVCDLELRSVNKGIVGSEKRETKGEEQGKADGCSKTCFYTTRRNLFSPIRTANCNTKGKLRAYLAGEGIRQELKKFLGAIALPPPKVIHQL